MSETAHKHGPGCAHVTRMNILPHADAGIITKLLRKNRRAASPAVLPIGEGVGHGRSMGRIGFAVVGGFLILNSYLFLWLLPGQTFAAELCAFIGAVILAFPSS